MEKRGRLKRGVFPLILALALCLSAIYSYADSAKASYQQVIGCSGFELEGGKIIASTWGIGRGNLVQGKIVDTKGDPLGGEMVIAEWDGGLEGIRQEAVRTITKEEADRIGDSDLEGMFFFPSEKIDAKKDTQILLKTQPRSAMIKVLSDPSVSQDVGSMVVLSSGMVIDQKARGEKIKGVLPEERVRNGERANRIASSLFPYSLIAYIILLGLVFIVPILKKRHGKRKIDQFFSKKDPKLFGQIMVGEAMSKPAITISKKESLSFALSVMIEDHLGSLVVEDESGARGVITQDDVLEKVSLDKKIGDFKVEDVYEKDVPIANESLPLSKAIDLMIQKKTRKLTIISGKKAIGVFTLTDALGLLSDFFEEDASGKFSLDLPYAENVMERKMHTIQKSDSLLDAANLMKKEKVSALLVIEREKDHGKIVWEEGLGIITSKDIVGELYKNQEGLSKLSARHVMSSPLLAMDRSSNVAQIAKAMKEGVIRRVPIKQSSISYEAELVGMVDQAKVVGALAEVLKRRGKMK